MSDYLQRLQDRQADAENFDRAMVERYGAAAHDCTTWESFALQDYYDWLSNAVNSNFHQEKERPYDFQIDYSTGRLSEFPAPLPYSPKFLHRFCEMLLSRPVNIVPTLEFLFDMEDQVDRDYVLGLLAEVENAAFADPHVLSCINGLGEIHSIVIDLFGEYAGLSDSLKSTLISIKAEQKDKETKEIVGEQSAWRYLVSGVPMFDSADLRRGMNTVRDWLSRRNTPLNQLSTPDVKTSRLSRSGEYSDFYAALVGGFTTDELKELLGNQHLGLYDFTNNKPTPVAKARDWASLYWALKLLGFLPKSLSIEKGAALIKGTFGASVSKSALQRIGDEDVEIESYKLKPTIKRGVYRIYNLLKELAIKP